MTDDLRTRHRGLALYELVKGGFDTRLRGPEDGFPASDGGLWMRAAERVRRDRDLEGMERRSSDGGGGGCGGRNETGDVRQPNSVFGP
jgi:hypothetical protein